MNIKKFNDFVNESYLKGGRQPIYHYTHALGQVLGSDTLKVSRVARPENTKAICFTRTPYFTHDDDYTDHGIYLTLDYDKLRIDGYNIYPIDELGIAFGQLHGFKDREYKFGKADIRSIEDGERGPRHKLKLPNPMMEREFEERCYENIDNLGKYLISINFASGSIEFERKKESLIKYLEKYPHIKMNHTLAKD